MFAPTGGACIYISKGKALFKKRIWALFLRRPLLVQNNNNKISSLEYFPKISGNRLADLI